MKLNAKKWFTRIVLLSLSCSLCSCMNIASHRSAAQPGGIRVLIVDGFGNHDWQQTSRLIRRILESTGRFTVENSTAPISEMSLGFGDWQPQFSEYDVVIQTCNSLGTDSSWHPAVQQDLEKFVRKGGGLLIFHSGNNSFSEWEEYNRMIGLGWRPKDFGTAITIDTNGSVVRMAPGEGESTSHGERFDAVLTRLGDHPIHKGLPRQWKAADLEVYSYARGPAEKLTVLSYAKEPETGLNFPVEWVVKYGRGRVYNSTFGHVWSGQEDPPGMRCAGFQTILVRAVEWLSGSEVTWPVPGKFPDEKQVRLMPEES